MLNFEVLSSPEQLDPLADEWSGLQLALGVTSPFHSHAWFRSWTVLRSVADDQLRVAVAREAGLIRGVIPFWVQSDRISGVPVRLLGIAGGAASFMGPLFGSDDVEVAEGLLRSVMGKGGWDVMRIPGVCEDAPCRDPLESALKRQGTGLQREAHSIAARPFITLEASWEAMEKSMKSSLRQNVRRRTRRATEQGRLKLEQHRGEEVCGFFREAREVEERSWKGLRKKGIFQAPTSIDAHEWFIRHWEGGVADLSILRLDDEPIAFQYGFISGACYYAYSTSFSEAHRGLSPGLVLMGLLIQQLISEKVRKVDLLTGDDPYKLDWASGITETFRYEAFPAGLRGAASRGLLRGAGGLLRKVSRSG